MDEIITMHSTVHIDELWSSLSFRDAFNLADVRKFGIDLKYEICWQWLKFDALKNSIIHNRSET